MNSILVTEEKASQQEGSTKHIGFVRYPEYKDSGIEWLGEVPAHWDTKPLKTVATCNDDVLGESTEPDLEIQYVEISGVEPYKESVDSVITTFAQAPSRARRRVVAGDVLISTVRTYLRAITPISKPPDNLIVSTGFAVVRPRRVASTFLGYLVRAEFFIAKVIAYSVGVSYPAINARELMRFDIPIPTDHEQTAIAAFLGRETAKIDALITEQEKLIALLKEKRQAVISHAVTKGLNPNVPMKSSGVEWLGEVPAHWEVRQFRRCLTQGLRNGIFKKRNMFGQGTPIVNVLDVYTANFKLDYSRLDRLTCESGEMQDYAVEEGDLFFVRSSLKKEGIAVAVVALEVPEPTVFECHLVRARPDTTVLFPRFASFVLAASRYRDRLVSLAKVTTMTTIEQESIHSLSLVLPPTDEQMQISAAIDLYLRSSDKLVDEANAAIALLKERRSALISAAVTGQIDVSSAAERVAASQAP